MKNWEDDITPAKIILVLAIAALIMSLFTGCIGTYYLSDAEYSDVRESHASVTYYDNQVYWGWHSGYYYYYGKPHYYPWYYYYNACPPSHYGVATHVVITRPVNRPTHRPNRPTVNRPKNDNTRIYVKPNKHHNTNKTNVIIKPNRNKNKVTNRRRPK